MIIFIIFIIETLEKSLSIPDIFYNMIGMMVKEVILKRIKNVIIASNAIIMIITLLDHRSTPLFNYF